MLRRLDVLEIDFLRKLEESYEYIFNDLVRVMTLRIEQAAEKGFKFKTIICSEDPDMRSILDIYLTGNIRKTTPFIDRLNHDICSFFLKEGLTINGTQLKFEIGWLI